MFLRINRKDIWIFVLVFVIVGAVFLVNKRSQFQSDQYSVIEDSSLPKVEVATSFPLAVDWLKSVGQDRVNVSVIASPADSALDSWVNDVKNEDNGFPYRIFFSIGNDFDDWSQNLGDKTPKIKVVQLSQFASSTSQSYVDLMSPQNKIESRGYYYWLSLENAREAVQGIARSLGTLDVGNKEYYINNAYEYSISLDTLLSETLDTLKHYKNLKVALQGTDWKPFADSLQLHVSGAFDISIGEYGADKGASSLRTNLKKYSVKSVIADKTFKTGPIGQSLQNYSFGVAGLDIWGLDAGNYLDYMRSNISELLRTL